MAQSAGVKRYTAERCNEENAALILHVSCHSREGGNPGLRVMAAAEL